MSVSHVSGPELRPGSLDPSDRPTRRARAALAAHGEPAPEERFELSAEAPDRARDALATCLMDLYRCTHDSEVFELLAGLCSDGLLRRVRTRLRFLASPLDPDEVLQDVLVNIYRYPDRFDGARPGAFRAWSSTIVDNSIRRQLRRRGRGPELVLQPSEELNRECDPRVPEPGESAARAEACRHTTEALGLLLQFYLHAYAELNERERFVLQMVEVQGARYAQIAAALGVRPEALKMVVFRARRRIQDKLTVMFAQAGVTPRDAAA